MRRVVVAVSTISLGLLSACAAARGTSEEIPDERACAGLPDAAVNAALDDMRAGVVRVTPLHEAESPKAVPHLVGAVVEVGAAPGLTAPWLGRVLACDTARHAAALVPPGASRAVTLTPTGFAVAVRSRDPEIAREIERRMRAFARLARPGTPP